MKTASSVLRFYYCIVNLLIMQTLCIFHKFPMHTAWSKFDSFAPCGMLLNTKSDKPPKKCVYQLFCRSSSRAQYITPQNANNPVHLSRANDVTTDQCTRHHFPWLRWCHLPDAGCGVHRLRGWHGNHSLEHQIWRQHGAV